jgi:hypothetical protein
MFIVKYADGASSRPYERIPVLNSGVVFFDGAVKLSAGGVDGADAASDSIYGICKGFMMEGGSTPLENALDDSHDGTLTSTSFTAASDNQTDETVVALVEPILPGDVIRAELDATIGTTTGSDDYGYYISILTSDERKLDESSAHATNQLQFLIVGQPGKGDYVDVKLVENQMNGNVGA